MKLRIICALLAFLILVPVVTACAENTDDGKTTNPVTTSVNDAGDETDRTQIKDTLPGDLDFGGAAWRILVRDDAFFPNLR